MIKKAPEATGTSGALWPLYLTLGIMESTTVSRSALAGRNLVNGLDGHHQTRQDYHNRVPAIQAFYPDALWLMRPLSRFGLARNTGNRWSYA